MRLLLLLILFINTQVLLSQDSSLVEELVAKWNYSAGYFDYNLDLRKDGRYKLSLQGDLMDRISEGFWTLKSDSQIVFNSDFQEEPSSMIKEESFVKSKYLTFYATDIAGDPLDFLIIKLIAKNEIKDTFLISHDGKFIVPEIISLDSIKIINPIFQNLKWKYDKNFNQFQLVFAQKGYSRYIVKQNEIWIFKNDRLYSPKSINDNKFYDWIENRKDYFEKIKN